jgi:hypothetical protein
MARLRRILAATHTLFGEVVLGPPERYPDETLLLASIAEAHNCRVHLRRPARVVYSNLKNGVPPAQEFLDDPLAHLPVDFLRQAGLADGVEDLEGEGDEYAGLEGHASVGGGVETGGERVDAEPGPESTAAPRRPTADVSVDLLVIPSAGANPAERAPGRVSGSARWAWRLARTNLLLDMRLPTFEHYVESLQLVHFDPLECAFTIWAPDESVHAWVEARLKPSLERLLSGACHRTASVTITYPDTWDSV